MCIAEEGAEKMKKEGSGGWIGPRILTELALIQCLSLPTASDVSILSQKLHLNSQHQQVAFQYVAKSSLGLT